MSKTTKTVTITIPIELYEKLLEEAKQADRSLSNYIATKLKYIKSPRNNAGASFWSCKYDKN